LLIRIFSQAPGHNNAQATGGHTSSDYTAARETSQPVFITSMLSATRSRSGWIRFCWRVLYPPATHGWGNTPSRYTHDSQYNKLCRLYRV
jgi:hypothetical protein